jgi:hypothetical protein
VENVVLVSVLRAIEVAHPDNRRSGPGPGAVQHTRETFGGGLLAIAVDVDRRFVRLAAANLSGQTGLFQEVLQDLLVGNYGRVKYYSNCFFVIFFVRERGKALPSAGISCDDLFNTIQITEIVIRGPESSHANIRDFQVITWRRIG